MAKRKTGLDKLVTNNHLAQNYARSFKEHSRKLDELAKKSFESVVRGDGPPKAAFKALERAAQDLNYALEGLDGAEPLKMVQASAAALCGSIQRLARSLGGLS